MAVKTIGTGGDYSTVQAWEDSLSATLTEAEEGQCKNEEFLASSAPVVDFSAHDTTLGTLTLTAASGASFKDNANIRTNGLRYNASNGCGFRETAGYLSVIKTSGSCPGLIIKNLQVKGTQGGSSFPAVAADGLLLQDCIVETTGVGTTGAFDGGFFTIANCLFINSSGDGAGCRTYQNALIVNCVAIQTSDNQSSGVGFKRNYSTPKLVNCASFGFATPCDSSFDGASNHNATDAASGLPGSSNQHSVTYSATTPFVQADSGSALDFRLANDANALIDNGAKDATNAPADISGTTRASACEIGIWELAGGGGGTTFVVNRMMMPIPGQRRTRIIQL